MVLAGIAPSCILVEHQLSCPTSLTISRQPAVPKDPPLALDAQLEDDYDTDSSDESDDEELEDSIPMTHHFSEDPNGMSMPTNLANDEFSVDTSRDSRRKGKHHISSSLLPSFNSSSRHRHHLSDTSAHFRSLSASTLYRSSAATSHRTKHASLDLSQTPLLDSSASDSNSDSPDGHLASRDHYVDLYDDPDADPEADPDMDQDQEFGESSTLLSQSNGGIMGTIAEADERSRHGGDVDDDEDMTGGGWVSPAVEAFNYFFEGPDIGVRRSSSHQSRPPKQPASIVDIPFQFIALLTYPEIDPKAPNKGRYAGTDNFNFNFSLEGRGKDREILMLKARNEEIGLSFW